jgi:hypothetical protein
MRLAQGGGRDADAGSRPNSARAASGRGALAKSGEVEARSSGDARGRGRRKARAAPGEGRGTVSGGARGRRRLKVHLGPLMDFGELSNKVIKGLTCFLKIVRSVFINYS